jgi:hypothetical protein
VHLTLPLNIDLLIPSTSVSIAMSHPMRGARLGITFGLLYENFIYNSIPVKYCSK